MADLSTDAIYCNNIGNTSTTNGLQCCYLSNQSSSVCQEIFGPDGSANLAVACNGTAVGDGQDCLTYCGDNSALYSSQLQDGNNAADNSKIVKRYLTCVNVPAIARYDGYNALDSSIYNSTRHYVTPEYTDRQLTNVTDAVTACLTATCSHSRDRSKCSTVCSAVHLLTNSTTPNIAGINVCLNRLCNGHYSSVPYADADVVGIGVFASYIMQCMLVVLLFLGLVTIELSSAKRRRFRPDNANQEMKEEDTARASQAQEASKSQEAFINQLLVEFHTAQCYFSGTIQIASLNYGIFSLDMLIAFMLMPLATNGVLPVVFGYLLLFRCGKLTPYITRLTLICWVLSTLVYWILYKSVIPINTELRKNQYHAYEQFTYKLAAIPACGGYSALAACPKGTELGRGKLGIDQISDASFKIRVLTPIIWSFSTACLLAIVATQTFRWYRKTKADTQINHVEPANDTSRTRHDKDDPQLLPTLHSVFGFPLLYWLAMLCFLAGIGMQLSLLAIGTSLKIINRHDWSFGQIIAVTIWIPPLHEYLSGQSDRLFKWWKHRWSSQMQKRGQREA